MSIFEVGKKVMKEEAAIKTGHGEDGGKTILGRGGGAVKRRN